MNAAGLDKKDKRILRTPGKETRWTRELTKLVCAVNQEKRPGLKRLLDQIVSEDNEMTLHQEVIECKDPIVETVELEDIQKTAKPQGLSKQPDQVCQKQIACQCVVIHHIMRADQGFHMGVNQGFHKGVNRVDQSLGGVTNRVDQGLGGVTNRVDQGLGGVTNRVDQGLGAVTNRVDQGLGGVTNWFQSCLLGHFDFVDNSYLSVCLRSSTRT